MSLSSILVEYLVYFMDNSPLISICTNDPCVRLPQPVSTFLEFLSSLFLHTRQLSLHVETRYRY
jgi:hypothetical protein